VRYLADPPLTTEFEEMRKLQPFQIILSKAAAAKLSREECTDIVQRLLPLAEEQDRGIHEGLTFAFDSHGDEWKVIVDLKESWVKFLQKDELHKEMTDALRLN